jgi:hypothetical protein
VVSVPYTLCPTAIRKIFQIIPLAKREFCPMTSERDGLVTSPADIVYLSRLGEACQEGAEVERINGFSFYGIGKTFSKVMEMAPGDVPRDQALWITYEVTEVVKKLIAGDPIPLGLSKGRAQEFQKQLNLMQDRYFSIEENGVKKIRFPREGDEPIPRWAWTQLQNALSNLETVLSDEMREAATYYVPRRGIYWTPALVDSAEETFPEAIRGHVPQKACDDWRAAGRCLAFSLLTASGFHAARAVESMLEAYYQLFSGKPGKTLRSWDDYIKALTKVAEGDTMPKPSGKTLSELDQMRTFDRNPIMHPRVVLSEGDARILFGSSESLIIAMAQELKAARDSGGVQPDLALIKHDTNSAA